MDPSKSPSAPPPEKPGVGPATPPPYYDSPIPGYPRQPPGYAPPAQYVGAGYGQQHPENLQYPGQVAAIVVQPTQLMVQTPLANPYNDYLGYSIFTMLCCCLPIGVAALVFSIFTREANRAGSQMDAERNSKMARTLNHVALGVGLGLLTLYIVYILVITLS